MSDQTGHWEKLESLYGEQFLKKFRNREWQVVWRRHRDKFAGMEFEEYKRWALWVRGRAEVDSPPVKEIRPSEKAEESDADLSGAQYVSGRQYWYDEGRDTYITFLPGVPTPLEFSGQVHRDIIRAYSNWDGQPASLNAIAREFGLPRNWVVKYLKVHQITHDCEPFSAEELQSRPEEELVEEALQMRRASLYRKFERKKWASVEKDAERWRNLESELLRFVGSTLAGREARGVRQLNVKPSSEPFAAVIGLSDFHWGKYSDPGENWEGYDRDEARRRLFASTEDVIERTLRMGTPEKFIVPVGSDFLQIDNDKMETTRGTSQDCDGTPAELFVSACDLLEDWIDTLRQVAPVELVLMSGNHDRMTGVAMLMFLDGLYRTAPDVVVHRDRQPRTYHVYGSNLIGFVHGDGVSKTKDMAGHMARESGEGWVTCKHKTIYTGHLHYEKTETDVQFGVTRRQLTSLSGPDRWHARSGYVGAPKGMPLYVHDKKRGMIAVIHGPVHRPDPE